VHDKRVHYARNGDVHLAYRIWGDREPTLVWIPGWVSNVSEWDADSNAVFTPFLDYLDEHTRLVAWDKRGTGLSDPVTHVPPLDERMDDLRAVMDAVGAQCPAIFGISEGGPMSILFAATYPERVHSLVLYGTLPRFTPDLPDFPWGFTPEQIASHRHEIETRWGEGALADVFFGELTHEVPGFLELYGETQPKCASPRMALMLWDALSKIDVRQVLEGVRVPTLVLGRPGDLVAPVEGAEALAASIPSAQFQALPPGPHGLFDEAMASAIVDFVCDTPSDTANERVLSTVFFTDIVGSTERLSAAGDTHWRHELDLHDRVVDNLLTKYGGRRAKHTGDGVFALFDGPTKAARCGLEMVPALATRGIRIRAGVHIGECERRGDEWSGTAVHVGARIGAMAAPNEVLASRTVRDLSAGSGLRFESLGAQRLKGIPDETEVFRVSRGRP
jgi:pimeloyl-ACP methyl ester carboxylesterase/class 3 adenylate cyclase